MANPAYVQIHPTCIPVHGDKQSKPTLMSESLRNDGRIWVPKLEDAKKLQRRHSTKEKIFLRKTATTTWNAVIRHSVTLVPRDVASRAAKERCDKGFGVNNTGLAYSSTLAMQSTVWARMLWLNATVTFSICMKKSPT